MGPSATSQQCLLRTRVDVPGMYVLERERLLVVASVCSRPRRASRCRPQHDGRKHCVRVRGAHAAGPWRLRPAALVLAALAPSPSSGTSCRRRCFDRIDGDCSDRRWLLFLTSERDFSMCVETTALEAKWRQMVEAGKCRDAREFLVDCVDLVCRSLRDGARACRANAQSAGRGPTGAVGVRCAAG